MIDRSNKAFNLVKNAIGASLKGSSQTYTDAPSEFPYMFFDQINNSMTANDLSGNENAVNPVIEITIYSTGGARLPTATKIMKLADTQMKAMGFRRDFGPRQVTNVSDTNICRLVARFSRVIASGDIF